MSKEFKQIVWEGRAVQFAEELLRAAFCIMGLNRRWVQKTISLETHTNCERRIRFEIQLESKAALESANIIAECIVSGSEEDGDEIKDPSGNRTEWRHGYLDVFTPSPSKFQGWILETGAIYIEPFKTITCSVDIDKKRFYAHIDPQQFPYYVCDEGHPVRDGEVEGCGSTPAEAVIDLLKSYSEWFSILLKGECLT